MTHGHHLRLIALTITLSLLPGCGPLERLGLDRNGVDAELVVFDNLGAVSTAASTSGDRVVLDSPAAVSAFADRFDRPPGRAADLRVRVAAATTRSRWVLIGFTGLGCAENGARLRRQQGDLVVEFTGRKDARCVAASQLVAVFAVDRTDLPDSKPLVEVRP